MGMGLGIASCIENCKQGSENSPQSALKPKTGWAARRISLRSCSIKDALAMCDGFGMNRDLFIYFALKKKILKLLSYHFILLIGRRDLDSLLAKLCIKWLILKLTPSY